MLSHKTYFPHGPQKTPLLAMPAYVLHLNVCTEFTLVSWVNGNL